VADGKCHGKHGEAEGEGNTDVSDAKLGERGGENGRAASAENQPTCAEELGEKTLSEIHISSWKY
jgi:hypothetical protein